MAETICHSTGALLAVRLQLSVTPRRPCHAWRLLRQGHKENTACWAEQAVRAAFGRRRRHASLWLLTSQNVIAHQYRMRNSAH